MSTSLYILPESLYKPFLESWDSYDTYEEYGPQWENATTVYTNFSGNLSRLYDVTYDMDDYDDEFTKEMGYYTTVATKEKLEQILAKQTDEALLEKWNGIMECLEKAPDDERLYFFTD